MGKKAYFVVGQWSRAGGLEIVTQRVATVFRDQGYDVTILAVRCWGADGDDRGMHVRYLEPHNRIARSLWHRYFKYRVVARILKREIASGDAVVFGHTYLLPILNHVALPPKTLSWVWTHDKEVWDEAAVHWRPLLNRLTRVISVSEYTANHMRRAHVAAPISVVANCIDTKRYVPTKTPEKIRRDEILICSRIPQEFRYKGHERLLQVLPMVEKLVGHKVRLRVVGKGAGLEELKAIAHKMNLDDRVVFTGYVTDEEQLEAYQHCGVFCMPSTGEGFGLVYAEAEACARPVVVSTDGGAPETAVDGETGLYAPPCDLEANARAIAKILSNPVLADEMGRKGHLLANTKFTEDVYVARVVELLKEDVG